MHIEELIDEEGGGGGSRSIVASRGGGGEGRRALVGVGARLLFYPTLLYNVVRNRLQSEFHWWDEVDQYLLLGAVPFPSDVMCLKQLGVHGVVTLNEPYETLVPSSLYRAHGIQNVVIPTRDYLFAPSFGDICQAVDFIYKNALCGKTTYVHCKAGRGRSTTVVLCYLVQHRGMTPIAAYEYVRSRRPRVLLAASQWQAVQEYYRFRVKKTGRSCGLGHPTPEAAAVVGNRNLVAFDESSFVLVSETDLNGYMGELKHGAGNTMLAELYKVQIAGHAALARLSRIWVRYHARVDGTVPEGRLRRETCSSEVEPLSCGLQPFLLQGMEVKL